MKRAEGKNFNFLAVTWGKKGKKQLGGVAFFIVNGVKK